MQRRRGGERLERTARWRRSAGHEGLRQLRALVAERPGCAPRPPTTPARQCSRRLAAVGERLGCDAGFGLGAAPLTSRSGGASRRCERPLRRRRRRRVGGGRAPARLGLARQFGARVGGLGRRMDAESVLVRKVLEGPATGWPRASRGTRSAATSPRRGTTLRKAICGDAREWREAARDRDAGYVCMAMRSIRCTAGCLRHRAVFRLVSLSRVPSAREAHKRPSSAGCAGRPTAGSSAARTRVSNRRSTSPSSEAARGGGDGRRSAISSGIAIRSSARRSTREVLS